jgi:soluble lytic murein transglycosylase-like protein
MQIYEAADRAGLDRRLVRAVVLAESGGDPEARSPRGAVGLMQITPVTLQEVKRQNPALPDSDLTDPVYNLSVGTAYLASLMKRFDNDLTLALAGYHMGPTRVARLKRKHPTLSSQQLVDRFAGPQTKAYLRIVRELILEDTVETEN